MLKKQNLNLKSVTITAKEKVCMMEEVNCNPEYCQYANGYYDRINNGLKDIAHKYNDYGRENIEKIAQKYKLCPFELALDLTHLSDIVICDYNYVFDPKVYLKRYFDVTKTDFTFLIDESHNLVDRARSMYTKTLNQEAFLELTQIIGKKNKRIAYTLKEINEYFKEKEKEVQKLEDYTSVDKDVPLELCEILSSFIKQSDEYLSRSKEENKELLELYFDARAFVSIADIYDSNFKTIHTKNFTGVEVKLFCANPSKVITEKMKKAKSNIVFSATLIPMNY